MKKAMKRVPLRKETSHSRGDAHAAAGFRYECALRCLWMLQLRGTENSIGVGEEEDCHIVAPHRAPLWRQVKKRGGRPWTLGVEEFSAFLARAYKRYRNDPATASEFVTNNSIADDLVLRTIDGVYLDPSAARVKTLAPIDTDGYARTIRFYERQRQADAALMTREVRAAVRDALESTCADPLSCNLVEESAVRAVAARLLACESWLCHTRPTISWLDVDREIGFAEVAREVERRYETQSAFIRWPLILDDPEVMLPPEAAKAVKAVLGAETIARPGIELAALALAKDWYDAAKDGRAGRTRLIILAGPHASGKTVSLVHIGRALAGAYEDVNIFWGPPFPPSDAGRILLPPSSSKASVVLLDEVFDGWDGFLRLQQVYFPPGVLFVGCAPYDAGRGEYASLRSMLGDRLQVIPVEASPSEDELRQLAMALGRADFPPSETEQSLGRLTNFRHAVAMLRGERVTGRHHVEAVKNLKAEERAALVPVLLMSSLGVILPLAVLDRHVELAAMALISEWVIPVRWANGALGAVFEDGAEASALLDALWGAARSDWETRLVKQLLACSDPERGEDRRFVSRLLGALAAQRPSLVPIVVEKARKQVASCLEREPLWAIAFRWVPVVKSCGLEDLLSEAVRRVGSPSNVFEFVLFLEAYGVQKATRQLGEVLRGTLAWEPWTVVRTGQMIRRLPSVQRKVLGREFARLFMDLPATIIWDSLHMWNAFTLLVDLVASYGGHSDRDRAMRELESLFQVASAGGVPISASWIEAYVDLADRTFQAARSALSLEVTRQILSSAPRDERSAARLDDIYTQEEGVRHKRAVDLAMRHCEAVAGGATPGVLPLGANFFSFIASWGQDEERAEVVRRFVSSIEMASQSAVPFGRVSYFVMPGLNIVRSGSEAVARRVLKAMLAWAPGVAVGPTSEMEKWLVALLLFAVGQAWIGEPVRSAARGALFDLFMASDAASENVALAVSVLAEELVVARADGEALAALVKWSSGGHGSANELLIGVSSLEWPTDAAQVLAGTAMKRWAGDPFSALNLARCVSSRMRHGCVGITERRSGSLLLSRAG